MPKDKKKPNKKFLNDTFKAFGTKKAVSEDSEAEKKRKELIKKRKQALGF